MRPSHQKYARLERTPRWPAAWQELWWLWAGEREWQSFPLPLTVRLRLGAETVTWRWWVSRCRIVTWSFWHCEADIDGTKMGYFRQESDSANTLTVMTKYLLRMISPRTVGLHKVLILGSVVQWLKWPIKSSLLLTCSFCTGKVFGTTADRGIQDWSPSNSCWRQVRQKGFHRWGSF